MKCLLFNVVDSQKRDKCQKLHIGKDHTNCIPVFARDKALDNVKEIVYLGDIVEGSGKHTNNILNRVSRGKRIVNDIFSILENLYLGPHFFQVALLLRETMLLSSVLYNACIWYNVSSREIKELNTIDKCFFTRLFKVASSANFVSFFLETREMEIEMHINVSCIFLTSLTDQETKLFMPSS